nr:hypothetical protein [uncultured Agathobaculum sp.]
MRIAAGSLAGRGQLDAAQAAVKQREPQLRVLSDVICLMTVVGVI